MRNAQACSAGGNASPEKCDCIDKNMVNGKLVLCGASGGEGTAYANGAIGSIINSTRSSFDKASVTDKPSLNLETKDFVHVQSYTNSTKYPVAEILKSEIFHDTNAPRIASFSSRGPNNLVLEIMKPDVNWSPAAIKSAIMTTTKPVKSYDDDLAGEFAYGSGNINPQQAIHPGLVYDISKEDYVQMLCNYGYDANKIKQISGDNSSCDGASKRALVKDINYPAMVIPVRPYNKNFHVKIHRTVTNVGFPNTTYKATLIHHNPKIKIM
ncbi:subtilisin-like serine protease, partial [Trifolium medium]|nr:subtilisin-like serine protease [Trifolium medium]